MSQVDPRQRLLELLLLVRDDAQYVEGYYVLRAYTVTKLLEQAIVDAQGLLAERRADARVFWEAIRRLSEESEEMGLYE